MQRKLWLVLFFFVAVALPARSQGLFGSPAAESDELVEAPAEKDPLKTPEPAPSLADREFQAQVLERMQQPVDWVIEDEVILDLADRLSEALGITVLVDWESLEDLGLAEETSFKGKFKQLPLEQALEYLLDQHELSWMLRGRALVILSEYEQLTRLDTRVYDVRDLVSTTGIAAADFEMLIDLLINTIDADTWAENGGGEAEIRPLQLPRITALVISQTQRTHRKIDRLLAEIRLVRGTETMPIAPTVAWGDLASRLEPLAASLEETPAPEENAASFRLPMADSPELVDSATRANEFSFDLYRRVAKESERNQLVSGYGTRELLTIALCGAKGQTRRELERVLRFPEGGRGHGLESFALRSSMARQGRGVELVLAGGLWIDQGHPIRPEFVAAADRLLQATTRSLDFSQPTLAAQAINRWGAQLTKGRIEEFVDERHIVPPAVLTSAVYFGGRWATRFDKDQTQDKPFRLASGEEVQVPTLHGLVLARAARLESGTVIGELDYSDREASMVILLPPDEPGALVKLEETLTAREFDEWLRTLRLATVRVAMPKFTFDVRHELMPALAEMGLDPVSKPGEADFSGITDGLALQQVWQRCVIEVNERGTTAAALSGGGAFGGPRRAELEELLLDRPFLFFIRDCQTGCVLFQGRVMDARSE